MLGQKMKSLRLERKLTLEELANNLNRNYPDTINFNKGKLSKWENNREEPKLSSIRILADYYGIQIDDFYSKTISSSISNIFNHLDSERQAKVINYAQAQLDEQNNIIHIDEYQEIYVQSKVSAGTGILDLDPENAETISYKGKLPNYYDFAFKVAGNSMEPIFFDGDIIFVEKMNDVINGALMVVQIDDEAFIKKVYRENNCLRLVSLNKDYKDIIVDGKNEIRIVGKVVF